MLRLWAIVLTANLVGTFVFAFCVAHIAVFDTVRFNKRSLKSALLIWELVFGIVLVRAIFAGWLIALMVWLLPAAEHSRLSIVIILTYIIGLGGFNHIIAGSTTVFFLVTIRIHFVEGLRREFLFCRRLLGNIIGGVSLVAALGHGQVVGGKEA